MTATTTRKRKKASTPVKGELAVTLGRLLPQVRKLRDQGLGNRKIGAELGIGKDAALRLLHKLELEDAKAKSGSQIIVPEPDLFSLPTAPLAVPEYAARITACMHKTVESYLMVGRLLKHAKDNLDHGQFTDLVERELPFTSRTAQRFMAIASDARLSNPTHVSHLPGSWGTLYELTKLDDNAFQARIADGTINPTMERRDISTDVKRQRRAARERVLGGIQLALPDKRYGVVVADPEWAFDPWSRETGMDRAADNHYPTSVTSVIAARDVPSIAANDCVLFLWATAPMLPHALTVMAAWGFDYKSHIVWFKTRETGEPFLGTGYWFRNAHELLLVGTRGNVPAPAMGTQEPSLLEAPIGAHSVKPDLFLQMIEDYFPTLPKIELNRRGPPRIGWDAWGNESESINPETGEITEAA